MAVYIFPGTTGNDTFTFDPNVLGDASIFELGGSADVLQILDRPGRTSGEFSVEGTSLIWRPFSGDASVSIEMEMGVSSVEFLEWSRLPEDGTPYTMRLRIITDHDMITGARFAVAGTQGNDTIDAPDFARAKQGWSEIYGNGGNDILAASNKHLVFLYGGRGDDQLLGSGRMDDHFLGDSGRDLLRGGRGDDDLSGGTEKDRLFGSAGKDNLFGEDGDDKLFGGASGDNLTGGLGRDRLSGNAGADHFMFDATNAGRDTITDFVIGVDRVLLEGIDTTQFSIQPESGSATVTVLATGQQIVFTGLQASDIQTHVADIFLLG